MGPILMSLPEWMGQRTSAWSLLLTLEEGLVITLKIMVGH